MFEDYGLLPSDVLIWVKLCHLSGAVALMVEMAASANGMLEVAPYEMPGRAGVRNGLDADQGPWHARALRLAHWHIRGSAVSRPSRFSGGLWACILVLFTAGCVSKDASWISRSTPTGITHGERVVIMLDQYREGGDLSVASPAFESSVEHCVKMGMLRKDMALEIVSAQDCRKAVYPACPFETAPRSAEQLLQSLKDAETARRFAELGVRYVVSVSVYAVKGGTQQTGDYACGGGGGHGGVCGGYINWDNETYTAYEATLVDVKHASLAGHAYASDKARQGGGAVLLYILPIPYVYVGAPGTVSCHELGSGMAELILQK
jgi:hypothetical protein